MTVESVVFIRFAPCEPFLDLGGIKTQLIGVFQNSLRIGSFLKLNYAVAERAGSQMPRSHSRNAFSTRPKLFPFSVR